jgi:hypothetical protein
VLEHGVGEGFEAEALVLGHQVRLDLGVTADGEVAAGGTDGLTQFGVVGQPGHEPARQVAQLEGGVVGHAQAGGQQFPQQPGDGAVVGDVLAGVVGQRDVACPVGAVGEGEADQDRGLGVHRAFLPVGAEVAGFDVEAEDVSVDAVDGGGEFVQAR